MDKKKLGALVAAVLAALAAFWYTYEEEMKEEVPAAAPVEVVEPVAPAVEPAPVVEPVEEQPVDTTLGVK